MRLVTFSSDGKLTPGIRVGDKVIDIPAAIDKDSREDRQFRPQSILDIIEAGPLGLETCRELVRLSANGGIDDAIHDLAAVTLVSPIPRPRKNVFCVGSNYRKHVAEASRAQAKENKIPDHPVFFTKPPTAVVGPDEFVRLDPSISNKLDYEVELGVVFGKPGRDIAAADAEDHIFGFTIINDISARDIQRRHGGQFLKGKGLDTSCPLGPEIVTLDELPNYGDLRIQLSVNGQSRQDGTTADMLFSIGILIQSLSEGMTLEPGDLLATGTPEGVGYAMEPPQFLTDKDEVTCTIEGIGSLTNYVREESAASRVA
jgi:2-keto-4-pentenoate hydratase/2-oxohepta-3-ene-1,7-dioic acid hydratase in catechol pathway